MAESKIQMLRRAHINFVWFLLLLFPVFFFFLQIIFLGAVTSDRMLNLIKCCRTFFSDGQKKITARTDYDLDHLQILYSRSYTCRYEMLCRACT